MGHYSKLCSVLVRGPSENKKSKFYFALWCKHIYDQLATCKKKRGEV